MKNNKSGTWAAIIVCVLAICAGIATCSDGGSSDRQKQSDTLKSGLNKYYSGGDMTKEEYNAVKSFNDWKYNNGEHSYSSWSNK